MTWYIVGSKTALGVTATEPRYATYGKAWTPANLRAIWFASSLVGRHEFSVKRGLVEEYVSYTGSRSNRDGHEPVYARVLPTDVEPELLRLLAERDRLLALLKEKQEERQEFLAAVVPRAPRVRVPASVLVGKPVDGDG